MVNFQIVSFFFGFPTFFLFLTNIEKKTFCVSLVNNKLSYISFSSRKYFLGFISYWTG